MSLRVSGSALCASGMLAMSLGCSGIGQKAVSADAAPVISATTIAARTADVPRFVVATGTLVAPQDAIVAAESPGKVVNTWVEVGTRVERGDPLVSLDTRVLRDQAAEATARVASAQAQTDQASKDCLLADKLAVAGGMSGTERDRALTRCATAALEHDAANARLAVISTGLANAVIRAPFDGVVADRMTSLGEYVGPGTPVVRVVATTPLTLSLVVPEREAGRLVEGQAVTFEMASSEGVKFETSIARVSPIVRERSRDRVVECVVPNDDGRLLPGAFVMARIAVGASPGTVAPKAAIVERAGDAHLFVARDGVIEERIVELGETVGVDVEVVDGVAANELIVSPLPENIVDGAHLTP